MPLNSSLASAAHAAHTEARGANPSRCWTDPNTGLLLLVSAMGGMSGNRGDDVAARVGERVRRAFARGSNLAASVTDANTWLLETANGPQRGQAASLAAVVVGDELRVVNIGSTRIGLSGEDTFSWIALDDTEVVCEHVLTTQAIGLSAELEVEEERVPWQAGDRVLLCTSAVHRTVNHGVLRSALRSGNVAVAAEQVAAHAIEREHVHASCLVAELS